MINDKYLELTLKDKEEASELIGSKVLTAKPEEMQTLIYAWVIIQNDVENTKANVEK